MQHPSKTVGLREAMKSVVSGGRIMVGNFGASGLPLHLIEALADSGAKDLTIISNDLGTPGQGLGKLLRNGQVKALVGNYYNWNPEVAEAYFSKKIQVTLLPQGTFAEAIRAGGVGIPAFYTPTAVGTDLAEGKETRDFNGRACLLEKALHADVALIWAYQADELGNLVYYKTARNFNPLMAMASKVTIAEVEEVVPAGSLDPEAIVTPHLYVDYIVERKRLNAETRG